VRILGFGLIAVLAARADTPEPPGDSGFPVAAAVSCDVGPRVVINEFVPDPAGSDGTVLAEWVELYVPGAGAIDVSGWVIERGKSSWDDRFTFPGGTVLASGSFTVVAESLAPVVDFDAGTLDLGNATSNADALRILDCYGDVVDTVVYGSDNKTDLWEDDSGSVALSLAAMAGSGQSLARQPDGADTDASGVDFTVLAFPTPGISNTAAPPDCGGPGSGVVINEVRVNPAGTDSAAGTEFVELYNAGADAVDLEGWEIVSRTSPSSSTTQWTFGAGVSIAPGSFRLIAGPSIGGADDVAALTLPNGTDGDSIALLDCYGFPSDTLVYGSNNDDEVTDDSGSVALSLALLPGDDEVLARAVDGYDTDQCGDDFVLSLDASPGAPNPEVTPVECVPSAGGVVINELLPNPKGDDAGFEWLEIYNGTGGPVNLGGWAVALATQAEDIDSPDVVFAGDVSLPAGGYLVVGGADVAFADVNGSVSIGNGTDGDGARLLDCDGNVVDTVVWGSNNDDLIPDDSGGVATSLADAPGSALTLARVEDGYDTDNCGSDFVEQSATPGAANPVVEPVVCVSSNGNVLINEVLANPEGTDSDAEWVELYNAGGQPVSVAGWGLALGSNGDNQDDVDVELPGSAVVPPGGYFVIGGKLVPEADAVAGLSIGNGTAGDSVRLIDCEGALVDTLVYGSDNEDLVADDGGGVATSLAPAPGDGESIARVDDGYDTDVCGVDFALSETPTPGASNPHIEPVVCEPGAPGVLVINEVLPDPDSTDTGFEWFELYNPTASAVSVAGWGVVIAGSGDDFEEDAYDVTFAGGISIEPGGFLVVGGEFVAEADVIASFSIGNGSGGDGMRLFDCERTGIDTVVYGDDNEDLIPDDTGAFPEFPSPAPDSTMSLARVEDGADQNSVEDWFVDVTPTPGESNYQEPVVVPEPDVGGGCFGKKDTPDGEAQSGCNSDANVPNETKGCTTVPLPFSGLELLLALAVMRRRRCVAG
jgi:hypothetical protein